MRILNLLLGGNDSGKSFMFEICENDLTLCLDEPENFLALPEIQLWLLQMADKAEQEACQIFFISHHPELINYLAASKGYWFELQKGRAVPSDISNRIRQYIAYI